MPQSQYWLAALLVCALIIADCSASPELWLPKGVHIDTTQRGAEFSFQHEVTIFGTPYPSTAVHYISRKNGRVTLGSRTDHSFDLSKIRDYSMLHPSEVFSSDSPDIFTTYQARLSGSELQKFEGIVRDNFWNNAAFNALGGHIFTWENQRLPAAPLNDNTFQIVIVYDASSAYALFNYFEVKNNNASTGRLLAGFSRVGSFDTVSLPFSGEAALRLHQESGLSNRTLGRYVYRIDIWPPLRGGCLTADGDRTLSSTVTRDSILGGSVAIVSGRCHPPGTSGTCSVSMNGARLGETATIPCTDSSNCTMAGVFLACRIPPAFRQGLGTLSLAINTIEGAFSTGIDFVSPDEVVTGKIELSGDFANWMSLSSQGLQITYDSTLRSPIHLRVMGYSESGLTQIDGTTTPIVELLQVEVPANGVTGVSSWTCPAGKTECGTHHIGYLEITDSSSPPRYLRSRILPLGWFVHGYYTNRQESNWYRQKCSALSGSDEATQRIRQRLQTLACPASLVQAKADSSRYLSLSFCPDLPLGCSSATPSQTCFVARMDAGADFPSAPASICCYASGTEHLVYQDFISGGGNDWSQHGSRAIRAHPDGVSPSGGSPLLPGRVPYMSHWYWDALQYLYCCRWSNVGDCPFYFMHERPTPKLSGFVAGRGAGIVGDPHMTSFSGRPYLFNGLGEYWLQRTDSSFLVQGRFNRFAQADRATFLEAIAVRVGTGAAFHVQVRSAAAGVARFTLYRRQPESGAQTEIALSPDRPFIDGAVTVKLASPDNVVLQLASNNQSMGIDLYAAEGFNYMNAYVSLSASLKGQTRGLLGRWTDNPAEEFVDARGATIAFRPNASEFHSAFCVNNLLASVDDSLFVYNGARASEFRTFNELEMRRFQEVALFSTDGINQHSEESKCNSNPACVFDIRVMQNPQIGEQTARKTAEFARMQVSANETDRYCEKPSIRGLTIRADAVLTEGASLALNCAPALQASRSQETIRCVRPAAGQALEWQPSPGQVGLSCQIEPVGPEVASAANIGLIVGLTVPLAVLLIVVIIVVIVVLRRRSSRGNQPGSVKGGGSSRQATQSVGASRTTIVSEGSTGAGIDNQGQANRRVQSGVAGDVGTGPSSMGRQYETRQQQQQQKQQQQQQPMGQQDDARRSYDSDQMVPMEPAGAYNPEYASPENYRVGGGGVPSKSDVV